MTIGALSFLSPWLLTGLFALPIIYWLLRTVPPRPRQIAFPPTRILVGIENREKTPDRTPWWLMLIRLARGTGDLCARRSDPQSEPRCNALVGGGPGRHRRRQWLGGRCAQWSERVRYGRSSRR